MTKRAKTPPKTERDWALYRATLNCKIARDAIDKSNSPNGTPPLQYAVYLIAQAIEEIANALREKQ